MDEEEQKSDSKISVSSFFERVDSVDKVANSALSQTRSNFGIIDKQRTLINSINVSIEALETKVRDIASYILAEKKLEKDAEEDRLFEQQDEAQKGSMLERLAGLKSNNESEQTQASGEEPKKGGGGILGTLLTLGIGAFAIKFLWPAILPLAGGLIKGALAKALAFTIGGIGTLIKGIIASSGLTKIGFLGIGGLFTWLANSAKDRSDKVAESASKTVENFSFNKEGKVSGADSLNVEGGGAEGGGEEKEMSNLGPDYKKQEEDAFKAAEDYKAEKSNLNLEENSAVNDMDDTLEKKDLIEKSESTYKTDYVGLEGGENLEGKNKLDFIIKNEIEKVESDIEIKGPTDSLLEKLDTLEEAKENLVSGDTENEFGGNDYLKNLIEKENIEYDPQENITKTEEIKPVVENKKLDLSVSDSFSDKLQPLNDQISTLSEDFTGSINAESGQMFSRPANSPNTTMTVFKNTSSNTPFTSLMSNKYLSLNKTLPPEVYRAIK